MVCCGSVELAEALLVGALELPFGSVLLPSCVNIVRYEHVQIYLLFPSPSLFALVRTLNLTGPKGKVKHGLTTTS